jgi:hypothetical protein
MPSEHTTRKTNNTINGPTRWVKEAEHGKQGERIRRLPAATVSPAQQEPAIAYPSQSDRAKALEDAGAGAGVPINRGAGTNAREVSRDDLSYDPASGQTQREQYGDVQ